MKKYLLRSWLVVGMMMMMLSTVFGQVAYDTGFPNYANLGTTDVTLRVKVTQGASSLRAYYVILRDYEQAPSLEEIKEGYRFIYDDDELIDLVEFDKKGSILIATLTSIRTTNITGLDPNTNYVVYFYTTNDNISIEVSSPTILTFSTQALPQPLLITSNSPINNSTDVPISTNTFSLTFNEDIVINHTGASIILYENGNFKASQTVVSGNSGVSALNNTFSVTFTNQLSFESSYYITIPSNIIQGISGSLFSGLTENQWSFTTEADQSHPAPQIIEESRTPQPGAVEVSRNPVVTVQFNEPIKWGNSTSLFQVVRKSDNVAAATFTPGQSGTSISTDLLSISFTSTTLAWGTEYYVMVMNDFVCSLNDVPFAGINDPEYWSFTTETQPPIWAESYPRIASQNANAFTFAGQTDQTGTIYFVVTSTGGAAPTTQQIVAGTNSNNQPARIAFNTAMTAGSEVASAVNFNANTPAGTYYYLYAVARSGDKYSEVIRLDIDRQAPAIEVAQSFPVNGYTVMPVDSDITLAFNEPVRNFDGPDVSELTEGNFALTKDGEPVAFTFAVNEIGDLITITPTDELDENSSYVLTITSIADEFGNAISANITRTFETDKLNVWVGAAGEAGRIWDEPSNWSGNSLVSGKSVRIDAGRPNYPLIASDVNVHNLTIEPGASLEQTNGNLTVTGIFTLRSSPSVNASYLPKGGNLTIDGSRVRIEQVVSYNNRTYNVASPVEGATPASIGVDLGMFYWNNPSGAWTAHTGAMAPGIGYITRSNNNLLFSGNIFRGDISVPVQYSSLGAGWNLIGNPYTATIDWGLLDINDEEIDNSFWIWDHLSDVYGVYNGETGTSVNMSGNLSHIPSNHSFLVRVKQGVSTSSVGFNSDALIPNTVSYLKSSSSTNSNYEHVKLYGQKGSFRDEVALVFVENASAGFDSYDSEKYFSSSTNVMELYTLAGSRRVAINGLPWVNGRTMPLGFSVQQAGNYTIGMSVDNTTNTDILLLDNGNMVANLSRGDVYSFSVGAKTMNQTRFSIQLSGGVSTNTSPKVNGSEPSTNIFVENKMIVVIVDEEMVSATYRLYDVAGRLIKSDKFYQSGRFVVGEQERGTYIIEIVSDNQQLRDKQKIVVF